jgi:hypothetical protein
VKRKTKEIANGSGKEKGKRSVIGKGSAKKSGTKPAALNVSGIGSENGIEKRSRSVIAIGANRTRILRMLLAQMTLSRELLRPRIRKKGASTKRGVEVATTPIRRTVYIGFKF